jgi:hypothetical protein
MAEDVFKNVQVLKGIPVNQFMETMGFFPQPSVTTARTAMATKCSAIGRNMPPILR